MRELLLDIRDFAYHAPGPQKDYPARLICLLAFYYMGALVLIARCVEYVALSGIVHIWFFCAFLIELTLALSLTSSIIYFSWHAWNALEKTPAPSELSPAEYCRKRRVAMGVLAIGVLFFIGSLSAFPK